MRRVIDITNDNGGFGAKNSDGSFNKYYANHYSSRNHRFWGRLGVWYFLENQGDNG